MAVLIDIPAFRDSLPAQIAAAADRLLDDGQVLDLEASAGGADAVVMDGDDDFQAWVGVVDRRFVGACPCADETARDGFCAHAAAVALAAFDAGIKLSAEAGVPGEEPAEPDFQQAAESLSRRQLIGLVVGAARHDPLFAARLMALEPGEE